MAMNREELLTELIRLGELPPKTWTNAELQVRMEELRSSHGLSPNPKAKHKTPLRSLMIQLNAAAVRKDSLIGFLKTELNTFVGSNETIAQLKKRGILAAYDRAPASPEDPVGFGMHAAASYQEVMDQHPKYADWVISTYQEGQADARLNRLACWLLKAQNQPEEVSKVKPYPITVQELRDQGYLRSSKGKPKSTAPSQSASSCVSEDHTQTSVTSSNASQQVLGELLGAFKELTEEVRELRAASTPDKHRKKGASSDSDFTVVTSKESK